MSAKLEILKQYKSLVKNIDSFSDGQASLSENQTDDDSLTIINVTISPKDGLYKSGKFEFLIDISEDYPNINPPKIQCLTKVYHPNIDQIDEYSEGDICLNLIDELWTPELTLEDYVQGLLFMFYNPNVEDPLNPAFGGDEDEKRMKYNVRMSMRGKEIEGMEYDNVLPDGYESDDGEDYEEEYDTKFGNKVFTEERPDSNTNTITTIPEEEEDVNVDSSTNPPANITAKVDDVPTTTTTPSVDEATGQHEPVNVNSKPVSNLVSFITRVLRFIRPTASFDSQDKNSVAIRSRFGYFIIYCVAMVTFRVGLRMFVPFVVR